MSAYTARPGSHLVLESPRPRRVVRNALVVIAIALPACSSGAPPAVGEEGDRPAVGQARGNAGPSGETGSAGATEPNEGRVADTANAPGAVPPTTGGTPRSCSGGPGANQSCGAGTTSCCASIPVPGGPFEQHDVDG